MKGYLVASGSTEIQRTSLEEASLNQLAHHSERCREPADCPHRLEGCCMRDHFYVTNYPQT